MTARRRVAVVILLAAMVVTGAACGDSNSGISSAAGAQLQIRVIAIRAAAANGDRDTVESQLADLRVDVEQYRADDKIDAAAADRILHAADTVKANLSLLEPATSPTTSETTTTESTTTTTTPRSGPPGKGKGKDKGGGD